MKNLITVPPATAKQTKARTPEYTANRPADKRPIFEDFLSGHLEPQCPDFGRHFWRFRAKYVRIFPAGPFGTGRYTRASPLWDPGPPRVRTLGRPVRQFWAILSGLWRASQAKIAKRRPDSRMAY